MFDPKWQNQLWRIFPQTLKTKTQTGVFQHYTAGQRDQYPTVWSYRHAEIPMNTRQYQLWDQIRTMAALGEIGWQEGNRVAVGMAKLNDEWNQEIFAVAIFNRAGEVVDCNTLMGLNSLYSTRIERHDTYTDLHILKKSRHTYYAH